MRAGLLPAALVCALSATSAAAQDHANHGAMNHGNHAAHEANEDGAAEAEQPAEPVDHSIMDHGPTDHSAHAQHPSPAPTAMPAPPPPPSSGPINAADATWGADAMRQSRDALYEEHGEQQIFWFQADRLELTIGEGEEGFLWDLQGYYGGDIHKAWFKSEGEGAFGDAIEDAEIQALYSHAIAPFFDLQAGVRQDFVGPERTHAVLGIQGLAPYEFEIDAALFLSTKGDLTARVEGEYDQRLSQRLILQPRVELEFSAQDIPELGTGSGLSSGELGVRLRYEIKPEFAPYIGIEQAWGFGDTKRFLEAEGEDASATKFVAGVRFWF